MFAARVRESVSYPVVFFRRREGSVGVTPGVTAIYGGAEVKCVSAVYGANATGSTSATDKVAVIECVSMVDGVSAKDGVFTTNGVSAADEAA